MYSISNKTPSYMKQSSMISRVSVAHFQRMNHWIGGQALQTGCAATRSRPPCEPVSLSVTRTFQIERQVYHQ